MWVDTPKPRALSSDLNSILVTISAPTGLSDLLFFCWLLPKYFWWSWIVHADVVLRSLHRFSFSLSFRLTVKVFLIPSSLKSSPLLVITVDSDFQDIPLLTFCKDGSDGCGRRSKISPRLSHPHILCQKFSGSWFTLPPSHLSFTSENYKNSLSFWDVPVFLVSLSLSTKVPFSFI